MAAVERIWRTLRRVLAVGIYIDTNTWSKLTALSGLAPVSRLRRTHLAFNPRLGLVFLLALVVVGASVPVSGVASRNDATSGGAANLPIAQSGQIGTDAATAGQLSEASNGTDTDGDGIPDSVEQSRYGTDPTDADTDGDGFPDGMEGQCNQSLPDADPLRTDIYVEVDSTRNQTLSDDVATAVVETFADAPVSNPDGSTGIDIHLVTNDTNLPVDGTVYSTRQDGPENDIYDFRANHSDYRTDGYYYVLLTDDVAYNGDSYYVGAGRPEIAAMELFEATKITASLFMHEFGHAMGLDAHQNGIDEKRYTNTEYNSVMNYNGLYDQLTYSDGTDSVGRDEWQFVAEERTKPAVQCPENGTCSAQCSPA